MKNYRCKCGKSTSYGSMGPYLCRGCDECGTTLATHPSLHKKPKPHDWSKTEVETDEGKKILTKCSWCGITKK